VSTTLTRGTLTIDPALREAIVNRTAELLVEQAFGSYKTPLTTPRGEVVYPYVVRNHSRRKAYVGFAGTASLRDEYRLMITNKTFTSNAGLAEDLQAQRAEDFTFEDLAPVGAEVKNATRGNLIVRMGAEGFTVYNTRGTGAPATK
jgi:hypothetical protein